MVRGGVRRILLARNLARKNHTRKNHTRKNHTRKNHSRTNHSRTITLSNPYSPNHQRGLEDRLVESRTEAACPQSAK